MDDLGVGGSVSGNRITLNHFGFRPARIAPGKNTATFAIVMNDSSEQDHLASEEINLNFYPARGSTLHSLAFKFEKHWCKNKVDIITAWRYCRLPSRAPKTSLHIQPELLNTPEKASTIITSTPKAEPVIRAGTQTFNGNFNTGLQGWKLDHGVSYSPAGGIENSGGLRMGSQAYIPSSPQSWKEAHASLCLPATDVESLSVFAHVKLEEVPEYTRAHKLGLTWHTTPDCSLGGQHGGYANIEKQLGWQTLSLKNKQAGLGSQSFEITLIQNQTYGQKLGVTNQEFRTQYSGKNSQPPAPVAAIWDDIQLEVEEKKYRKTESYTPAQETYVNLLNNPSFDATTAGWRGANKEHWQLSAGGRSGVLETRLVSDRGSIGTGAFSQCINLNTASGRVFDAGIKYQNVTNYTPGGGRLRITWYEDANCRGKYQADHGHDDISSSLTGWIPLEIYERKRPPNANSVSMQLIHSIAKNGERRIWWDDAYFYAVQ
ncbi:hypothetical protein [Marinagarivorans cellulosilyticus]|nr:hypothetical protein [Marinagarivorans cellulosilyticus]